MKTTHGETGVRPTAGTKHGVIENTHITAHTHAQILIQLYSVHTQRRRGNWQYLRNYISCGRRHTTTGKICNVDWLHLFLLLLHIGTDQSTPFRAPVRTSTSPKKTPSHLPQSQSWSRRQSQCFLCRSEWQLHFICSINLSQLDLSRDTYIYRSTKSKARPSARPDLWSGRKKCNRWLKSFAGSWNRIGANAFLSVYSMGSLTACILYVLRVYLCHSHANLMRCATEPAPAHRTYFCLSWNLIKEEVGANKNTQVARLRMRGLKTIPVSQTKAYNGPKATAIQHIGLRLWYTIKLRMAYLNKYMANMVTVGFVLAEINVFLRTGRRT